MILHTIIEADSIFYCESNQKHEFHRLNNCIVETCVSEKEEHIVRLYSTNPYDYLNPKLSPDSVFKP